MAAVVVDGKALAAELRAEVAERARRFAGVYGRAPALAVVLVGEDAASRSYVRNKERSCRQAGIAGRTVVLPAETAEEGVLAVVRELNEDGGTDGVLVQLPLPGHVSVERVVGAISPLKDVDAFHPENLGALFRGAPRFVPCTPGGVMRILKSLPVELAGREAVVVGRSLIVGKPLACLLLQEDLTVTVCHSKTRELACVVGRADVVVAAVGRPRMIRGEWVKPGCVVVDVGVNELADGTLCGDVEFEGAKEVAGYITPVPGGVGPLTVACLLENVVKAAEARAAGSH